MKMDAFSRTIPLHPASPSIYLCHTHLAPRMSSPKFPISISRTYLRTLQTVLLSWYSCYRVLPSTSKTHTRLQLPTAWQSCSTTHVPSAECYWSVCVQSPWRIVSAHVEYKSNISFELLLYARTGSYRFVWDNTLHLITPLSKQSQGQSAPTKLSGDPL
jgi:hypothetical protein